MERTLTLTSGCVCDAFEITPLDGSRVDDDLSDLSTVELQCVLNDVMPVIGDDKNLIINILRMIVEQKGTWKSIGHCDECGDNIYEWKLKYNDEQH